MRRLMLGSLLAVATAAFLIPAVASAATLERIEASGTVRLGFREDARPYSFKDSAGKPAGYIVELCREVVDRLKPGQRNLKAEFVRLAPSERFEAVREGRVDILCDPASVTMERRAMVDFSIPTFLDGTSVLYRADRPVHAFEDLAGKRVAVLGGTTTADNLRIGMRQVNITAPVTEVADHRDGLRLLTADKIDAYFGDRAILAALLYQGPMPGIELSRRYFSYETYALALPRGDDAFRLAVDRALAELY
ncbi:MAG: amino acid ABC transporter substrate-binding protein, partial [Pseudolabrys sp.]